MANLFDLLKKKNDEKEKKDEKDKLEKEAKEKEAKEKIIKDWQESDEAEKWITDKVQQDFNEWYNEHQNESSDDVDKKEKKEGKKILNTEGKGVTKEKPIMSVKEISLKDDEIVEKKGK